MRRLATVAVLALGLACTESSLEPEPEPDPRPARPPGLIRLDQHSRAASAHLTEVQVHADRAYVANSNELFAVYRLTDAGDLVEVLAHPTPLHRCTTLTIHAASDSLYCGSDEWMGVVRYDLTEPDAPVRDGDDYNPPLEGLRVADMAPVGDRLVFARYDLGIASAAIGPDGRLGALVEQPEIGNVRRLDADADGRLWALTNDRGLLVFQPGADGAWIERWQLELDGPALGLGVDGSQAAVGLGSAGLALVTLDETGLHRSRAIEVPGVVSAADLLGDVAVAVTLQGTFAYDLRDPSRWPEDPRGEVERAGFEVDGVRLLGFIPAGPWDRPGNAGVLLDGQLIARDGQIELLTSDWTWVERLAVDLDGFPAGVDVRRGEWVAAEAEVVPIGLRNPTPFGLEVDVQRTGTTSRTSVVLGPGETRVLELPANELEIDTPNGLIVEVLDGDEVVDASMVVVMRRAPLELAPVELAGRPAPGQAMPSSTLATGWPNAVEGLTVPRPGVAQRLVFYGIDCAAMWPEVEDLLWRVRSGRLPADAVVLASETDPTVDSAFDRWGLDAALWGYHDTGLTPPGLLDDNLFPRLYEDGFVLYELPSGAHHPTDYEFDAEGRVVEVSREYRGEHELRVD